MSSARQQVSIIRIARWGGYIPTIPKIAVKMASRVLFTKLENGPTHPSFSAAMRGVVQVASVTNGGEVLL